MARCDIIAEVALMKLLAFHKSVNNFHGEAIVFFFLREEKEGIRFYDPVASQPSHRVSLGA